MCFLAQKTDKSVYFFYLFAYLLVYTHYNFNNNLKYNVLPMKKTEYKRQFRELSTETKDRISHALKGRHLSDSHKEHLSASLKQYWSSVKSIHDEQKNNNSQSIEP